MMRFERAGRIAAMVVVLLCAWSPFGAAQMKPSASAPSSSAPAAAKYPELPSEIPAQFNQVTTSFNYEHREAMIPMRDGVRLHAVIVIPKGAKSAPILLTSTPYNAEAQVTHASSPDLAMVLQGYDNPADVIVEGGYIRAVVDVRGKWDSEGDYLMNRPLRGPLNPTPVDDSTDIYDTIDWLVKNVPETNGKVGVLGISYDGWTTLMAMFNPHPALKVVVPMNPMVDGWRGDDWFHNGAFREQMVLYFQLQEAARGRGPEWWTDSADDYSAWMAASSVGAMGKMHGLEQVGFYNKVMAHPTYDAFWQEQAVDKLLAKEPLKVAVLLVDSLWDQEDIYGAPAVYRAIKPKDTNNDMVYMVMGPWHHAQEIGDGGSLGALMFPSDTAKEFREQVLAPFLAQYLKDGAPKANIAPVTAYETGTNRWVRLQSWPAGCPTTPSSANAALAGGPGANAGCSINPTPLYLEAGRKLSFTAPQTGATSSQVSVQKQDANLGHTYEEYVSDPANPVPYLPRPVQPFGYGEGSTWPTWLVTDQRPAASRADVLTFVSDKLTEPVKIAGTPVANLVASTSGTDADWVVKLIDVYPDEVAVNQKMGGYELMIAADIFRGRYRESFSNPKAITADAPLLYKFALPNANHVFLPGHKIMVQVQSSWFPLYDRNPQTYVENIFFAKPGDFKAATERIYHAPGQESFVELPVVSGEKVESAR